MSTFSRVSRRQLLQMSSCGFGGLALHSLMGGLGHAAGGQLASRAPHHSPRAKRVIFLFMAGGPSQADLFDPKPMMTKHHGETIAAPVDDTQIRVGVEKFLAMAPVAPVRPRGESGMMLSDLMPSLAGVADELCLLRGMHTDNNAHSPAQLQLHTGALNEARPSMGAWISYGLGTENANLPSYVTIHPVTDVRTYGSSFLPAAHQGTPLTVPADEASTPIKYLQDRETSAPVQRRRLDFLQNMNQRLLGQVDRDAQMEGIIESFELAFRMQAKTPEIVDLSGETKATLDLYGIGESASDRNGRACLLARRMSEAGVRFVQMTVNGWDHHANIHGSLRSLCAATDKPIAGLLRDLKQRGLLDETLVVWSGEFGRSQWSQDLSGTSPIRAHGREHQQESFCTWMAGAGVKSGLTYGETDEYGFLPTSGAMHLYDLQATILHLLGIDHERLTYRHAGRDVRLTDVYGRVVEEILA